MSTQKLVTWGKHPAHGNLWLKLASGTSHAYREARRLEGWSVIVLSGGEKPKL